MGESGTIDRKRPLIRLRPFMYGVRGHPVAYREAPGTATGLDSLWRCWLLRPESSPSNHNAISDGSSLTSCLILGSLNLGSTRA